MTSKISMTSKRALPERKVLISTGIFLLLLMLIGSMWDYPISQMLYSKGNPIGVFLASFGEYPMGLALGASGAMLISARNREKKLWGILQVGFGALFILFGISALAQIPARQSSMPIVVSTLLCIVFVGLTVWGTLCLCKGADRRTVMRVAIVFVLFVFAEMIIVNVIKIPWGRPRMRLVATDSRVYFTPWWQPGTELKDTLVAAGVAKEEFKSFPSGHTANASCLLLLCLLPTISSKLENKRTLLFLIGVDWACIVAVSRIVMGAHYLTDTTIGLAVGFVTLILTTSILLKQNKTSKIS